MKATELRIGNIIKDDRKAKNWRFVTHRIISDLASNPNIELYHAIPLTEDWLLKFGFEYYADEDGGHWTNYRFAMQNQTWRVENQLNLRIQYVHQLQNLYFALTGEELTIKGHERS